jgi:hypothetical protein
MYSTAGDVNECSTGKNGENVEDELGCTGTAEQKLFSTTIEILPSVYNNCMQNATSSGLFLVRT